MSIRFVQDYGKNAPRWSFYYQDDQNNGHLDFGATSGGKFDDLLIQSHASPYFQFYLYNAGLDLKPLNGSDLAFQLYFTSNASSLTLGRGYSHFAYMYSNGLGSDFITQNQGATYVTNMYSSLTNAGIDIYTPNWAVFTEATNNEAYVGVQNAAGTVTIYLDTANIPSTAGNKNIILREIEICADGQRKKILILASEPYNF
jgi:hypothetical protein